MDLPVYSANNKDTASPPSPRPDVLASTVLRPLDRSGPCLLLNDNSNHFEGEKQEDDEDEVEGTKGIVALPFGIASQATMSSSILVEEENSFCPQMNAKSTKANPAPIRMPTRILIVDDSSMNRYYSSDV